MINSTPHKMFTLLHKLRHLNNFCRFETILNSCIASCFWYLPDLNLVSVSSGLMLSVYFVVLLLLDSLLPLDFWNTLGQSLTGAGLWLDNDSVSLSTWKSQQWETFMLSAWPFCLKIRVISLFETIGLCVSLLKGSLLAQFERKRWPWCWSWI